MGGCPNIYILREMVETVEKPWNSSLYTDHHRACFRAPTVLASGYIITWRLRARRILSFSRAHAEKASFCCCFRFSASASFCRRWFTVPPPRLLDIDSPPLEAFSSLCARRRALWATQSSQWRWPAALLRFSYVSERRQLFEANLCDVMFVMQYVCV